MLGSIVMVTPGLRATQELTPTRRLSQGLTKSSNPQATSQVSTYEYQSTGHSLLLFTKGAFEVEECLKKHPATSGAIVVVPLKTLTVVRWSESSSI